MASPLEFLKSIEEEMRPLNIGGDNQVAFTAVSRAPSDNEAEHPKYVEVRQGQDMPKLKLTLSDEQAGMLLQLIVNAHKGYESLLTENIESKEPVNIINNLAVNLERFLKEVAKECSKLEMQASQIHPQAQQPNRAPAPASPLPPTYLLRSQEAINPGRASSPKTDYRGAAPEEAPATVSHPIAPSVAADQGEQKPTVTGQLFPSEAPDQTPPPRHAPTTPQSSKPPLRSKWQPASPQPAAKPAEQSKWQKGIQPPDIQEASETETQYHHHQRAEDTVVVPTARQLSESHAEIYSAIAHISSMTDGYPKSDIMHKLKIQLASETDDELKAKMYKALARGYALRVNYFRAQQPTDASRTNHLDAMLNYIEFVSDTRVRDSLIDSMRGEYSALSHVYEKVNAASEFIHEQSKNPNFLSIVYDFGDDVKLKGNEIVTHQNHMARMQQYLPQPKTEWKGPAMR